jgi:hypothetical protein
LITLINGRKEKHPRKIITFTLANYIDVRLMAWANDEPRLRPFVVIVRKDPLTSWILKLIKLS